MTALWNDIVVSLAASWGFVWSWWWLALLVIIALVVGVLISDRSAA